MIDQDRPTTRKSRVIAHNQQIVRYDVERRAELKPAMQRRILRYVESRLRELSCLVVSDYAKGVVSATLMSELTRLAGLRGISPGCRSESGTLQLLQGGDGDHAEPSRSDTSRRGAWR